MLAGAFLGTAIALMAASSLSPRAGGFATNGYNATTTATSGITNGIFYFNGVNLATSAGLEFVNGRLAIGTTTPVASLQVNATTTNATSTVEVGQVGQNKGSCLKLYDVAGTPAYVYVVGTTLTVSATTCSSGTF